MIMLADIEDAFGQTIVYEKENTGERVYLQGGCFQSKTDRAGVSLVAYIHALYALLKQYGAQKVLMIGCGGGSLATMLSKTGAEVTVVDINPVSFDLARRFFCMPESVKCFAADGAEYLSETLTRFDAVVMDAFCGDSIPLHLRSPAFFRSVHAHFAKEHGLMLANVHVIDDSDCAAIDYAAAARSVWPTTQLYDAPGSNYRNAIVAAGDVGNLKAPSLQMTPESGAEEVAAELALLRLTPEA